MVTRLSVAIRVCPNAWLPETVSSPKSLDELARIALLLVDLDVLADAHHPQLGVLVAQPALDLRRLALDG